MSKALSQHLRAVALLAPALSVILILFAGGLLLIASESAGYFEPLGQDEFTLSHYGSLLADPEFHVSLVFSLWVAAAATALSASLGLALALAVRELAGRRPAFNTLLQAPLGIPHLAMAVALLYVAAPSGLLARAAYWAGLLDSPAQAPSLVHDGYGIGVILAYTLKETPFVAFVTLTLLLRTGEEFQLVARTLGASAWQRFRHVTLPLVAPALTSASLLVFAFVFGAFEVPFLLGRPYPAMLAVLAHRRFSAADLAERPGAIAIALAMTVLTALLVAAYIRLAKALSGVDRPVIY